LDKNNKILIGRCRDCAHWDRSDDDSAVPFKSTCLVAVKNLSELDIKSSSDFVGLVYHCANAFVSQGDIDIFTHKDFGCVFFEEREDK